MKKLKSSEMQYHDKIRKHFPEVIADILERAGVYTVQDIMDSGADSIMQIDGIGEKRFGKIAEVMINIYRQRDAVWIWNADMKKPKGEISGMGKKSKKKNPEKLAVYRIVDTKTLEVIYAGFTEELTKGTLGEMLKLLKKEAVNKGIALDSRYVLDYIPVKNKKIMFRECGNFRFWYCPVLNAFGDKDYPEITEEDNVKWKPFFSELHDGVVTNRNIIKALEKSGKVSVLKEFEWWNIMKAVFDSPETERALHTIGEAAANIATENVFIRIKAEDDAEQNLMKMRTAFIQLVNEKMEGKYKPLAVFQPAGRTGSRKS